MLYTKKLLVITKSAWQEIVVINIGQTTRKVV
jgi:hypothetical protein